MPRACLQPALVAKVSGKFVGSKHISKNLELSELSVSQLNKPSLQTEGKGLGMDLGCLWLDSSPIWELFWVSLGLTGSQHQLVATFASAELLDSGDHS